ncbi:hypothetical protein SAMD00079811_44610 [Scytonema sp. HK-05]|nr:hypothetical protein SAMD00079811_44610 [Scytonema sp. HK-05]
MPQGQATQQHPRFDTSTGSLDSPDAPRRVVQEALMFVLPNQTGFTHSWFHARSNPSQCNPIPIVMVQTVPNVCPSGTHSRSHCTQTQASPFVSSGQWLADLTMITYV